MLLDYFAEAVTEGAGTVKNRGEIEMAVSIEDIKKLKELTGVGLTDAKTCTC